MKFWYFLLCVFTAALMLFAITACSDDDETPTGTTPAFPTELTGVFEQESASVNGASQDLADFFEWDDSAASAIITVYSGGEQLYQELNSSDSVLYFDSGYFVVSGQNMTAIITSAEGSALATPDTTFIGTWDLAGSHLALTMIDGVDTVVMGWTKQ